MRVAYYSPLPPSRSGIADYSALLLPELEKRIDVVVARPGPLPARTRRPTSRSTTSATTPRRTAGSSTRSRRRPGVVVLHDFVLHHLVVGLTFARGDAAGYLAAMEREDGLVGRLLAYAVLDNKLPPLWETRPEDFPLAGEVLDHATGADRPLALRRAAARARPAYAGRSSGSRTRPGRSRSSRRPSVEGDPLYGCFGHLNETKRIAELVAAFARLRERRPGARLLLVGSLAVRLARLELPEGVDHRDYVPEDELWSLMAACDAIVSLRSPTMGETSGSAIRALSLGKPLVVSDVGWFAELPDDAVIKVPVDEHEEDTLLAALEALADPAVRAAMGARARELVEREHRLDRVAEAYAAALEQLAGGPAVDGRVLHEVATAAAEVGMDGDDAAVLAARLREVGLGDVAASTRGLASRARPRGPDVGLGRGLVVVSAGVRYALARRIVAPWIMVDELIYSELAKSFADSGHFLLRGELDRRVRLRLPGAAQPRVGALRRASRRRTRRRRRSTRSSSRWRRSRRTCSRGGCCSPSVRVRGGGAGDGGADAALLRDADDRERVLPGIPARRAGDGRLARAARPDADAPAPRRRSCSPT